MLDDLKELYQEVILDHSKHPRNFGKITPCSHEGHGYNPLCGDTINVYVALDEKERITDIAFDGKGCAISTASASMMTDVIKGKSISDANRLFEDFRSLAMGEHENIDAGEDTERLMILAGVKQFPMRVKCATLPWHAMHTALLGKTEISTE
ncbi:MAG: SUF system NifU family Fe-S cluster assembly protein [Pseudomonas marincola]